jgi:hypothetical protein
MTVTHSFGPSRFPALILAAGTLPLWSSAGLAAEPAEPNAVLRARSDAERH